MFCNVMYCNLITCSPLLPNPGHCQLYSFSNFYWSNVILVVALGGGRKRQHAWGLRPCSLSVRWSAREHGDHTHAVPLVLGVSSAQHPFLLVVCGIESKDSCFASLLNLLPLPRQGVHWLECRTRDPTTRFVIGSKGHVTCPRGAWSSLIGRWEHMVSPHTASHRRFHWYCIVHQWEIKK